MKFKYYKTQLLNIDVYVIYSPRTDIILSFYFQGELECLCFVRHLNLYDFCNNQLKC